jgi:hypothetical protein
MARTHDLIMEVKTIAKQPAKVAFEKRVKNWIASKSSRLLRSSGIAFVRWLQHALIDDNGTAAGVGK